MPYNPNIHRRSSIRLKNYDYSQSGMYFITICVQKHQWLFGKISDGGMILNDFGKIAYNEWMNTPHIRRNVQLDAFVVMPNHIHGIIVITDGRGELHSPLNDSPHIDTSMGECNSPLRGTSNTVGAIMRGYKSAVTKQLGYSIWQRNYWEHIIRNEKSYQRIADYIINNPVNLENDKFYTE
jgi:REP element-mobilizing transposase RayT